MSKTCRKRNSHIIIDDKSDNKKKSSHWEPSQWQEQWKNLLEMRRSLNAPVDTMGCERLANKNDGPQVFRYQVILSLMLSSQTKDEITSAAMKRLQDHGCNVENILATNDATLEELIYPTGFYKTKTRHIKATSQILKDKFDGDIPRTVSDLCSLPGVGPKMAHLVTKCAWGSVTGIAVDSHVHKICNRLGWTSQVTKTPVETQKEIEQWIPRSMWSDVNYIMVGFGQQICKTKNPLCASCLNSASCLFRKGVRK